LGKSLDHDSTHIVGVPHHFGGHFLFGDDTRRHDGNERIVGGNTLDQIRPTFVAPKFGQGMGCEITHRCLRQNAKCDFDRLEDSEACKVIELAPEMT
jgi:hypothetical protein